jgi:predicted RNA binding protein YcfA (HicA-like mRNA interferase family)
VKVRDRIKLVERDGWQHVRTTGSHRHYRHATKPGTVTIPGHPSDEVAVGTEVSIFKQAGLSRR